MPHSVPTTLPRPQFPVEPTGADRVRKAAPRSPQKPGSLSRRALFRRWVVAPAPPPAQQG